MKQREIKFRAWDKESSEMIYSNNSQHKGFYFDFDDSDLMLMLPREDSYPEKRDAVIMQYTGLKDKNGKEIYEGDIVLNGLSGAWIIQPLHRGSMSLLGICKKYKDSNYDIAALNSNVEVIGNIYENSGLLQSLETNKEDKNV